MPRKRAERVVNADPYQRPVLFLDGPYLRPTRVVAGYEINDRGEENSIGLFLTGSEVGEHPLRHGHDGAPAPARARCYECGDSRAPDSGLRGEQWPRRV